MAMSELQRICLRVADQQIRALRCLSHGNRRGLKRDQTWAIDLATWALAKAEPSEAPALILESIKDIKRLRTPFGPSPWLAGALAHYDPDRAVDALRFFGGDRTWALADIARSIARTDLRRAVALMARTERSGGRRRTRFSEFEWAHVAQGAAAKQPLAALALARKRVKSPDCRWEVMPTAIRALVGSGGRDAESAIERERDAELRARGWIVVARETQGARRERAIRNGARAIEQIKRPRTRKKRLTRVGLWCLLAALARRGPQARKYLAAAEAAMSDPPQNLELAIVMAAAIAIDLRKALDIFARLKRRTLARKGDNQAWHVLEHSVKIVARFDAEAAMQIVAESPALDRATYSRADRFVKLAKYLRTKGAIKEADEAMARAEEELLVERKHAKQHPKDECVQSDLWDAVATVAVARARFGKPAQGLHLAASMRDPGRAAQACLDIAAAVETKAPKPPDAFAEVEDAVSEMERF